MRNSIHSVVLTLAVVISFASCAAAQTDSMKVHFPAPVRVATTELPAGDYTIRSVDTGSDSPVLAFQNAEGRAILVAVSRCSPAPGDLAAKSSIVLQPEGGELHLTKIWLAGRGYGYQVIGTH